MARKQKPLLPRNGHTVVTAIVARISGGPNQKELSLRDQEDHGKEVVAELYEGPVEYRVISTVGKGERLDRPELKQIERMLRTREIDLLVAEDIGRIIRGIDAKRLCGIAVDHGTRVIAPNDCVDTNDESWEDDVFEACREHGRANRHTSKRLKQKLLNRFKKFGGAMAREIYGYVVPDDAKTYDDWAKDQSTTPIFEEWFKRLNTKKPNCSAVADWLNSQGIPTGPYCRAEKWDGRMVRRVTANPILKGMPGRGFRHTVMHHETGRRRSVRNPDGPEYKPCPHLEHINPIIWDDINTKLKENNEGLGRKPANGSDPRSGVSRKRTVWPGQHVRCGVCNRLYYWGGHGQNDHMMCSGARDYRCWNASTFDGKEASARIVRAILTKIEELPDFDAELLAKVRARAERDRLTRGSGLGTAREQLKEVAGQLENVAEAIATVGQNDVLIGKLARLTADRDELRARIARLERQSDEDFVLPPMAEVKRRAREAIEEVAAGSHEFGVALGELVPRLKVFPYRLCDGGGVVLRAELTLDLVGLLNPTGPVVGPEVTLRSELTVDLFDPPQRAEFRERVVQLRAEGHTEKQVAKTLGITVTAAQKAAALDRLMKELGLPDPYVAVADPPGGCTKMKRHKNPRYRFEPLPAD